MWADDSYTQITSLTDLDTKATYIIADVSSTTAYAFGAINSSSNRGTIITSGLSVSGTTITVSSSATDKPLEFTFTKSGDNYTIAYGETPTYLGYNSGTTLQTSTDEPTTNGYKWNVAYNDDYKCLLISNVKTNTRYILRNGSSAISAYASSNMTNANYGKSTLYKKVTASGPVDPIVSIASETIAVGGTTTISGSTGLSMTFSSNAEGVATVDANGIVTGVSAGSATITVSWSAVTDTYNAGSKQFTVTVIEASTFKKVTNNYELVPGNEYILVAIGNKRAMGAINGNIRDYVDVEINDDEVMITDEEVAVLTLGGSKNEWTFLASDNDEYIAYSGSSNQVHSNTDATADASKWVITSDYELESANVSGRMLRYNSGSPRFACYSSGQQTAVLFIKVPATTTKSVTDAGWATCIPEFDVEFAAGTAYVVTDASISSGLTLEPVTEIPAGTPVLLKGAGSKIATVLATTPAAPATNLLSIGTGSEDSGTAYVLAKQGTGAAFKKWIGDASELEGRVVLMVDNVTAARSIFMLDDETTGINTIDHSSLTIDHSVYNLNGQRVDSPKKGLYIVNGKKVVLK